MNLVDTHCHIQSISSHSDDNTIRLWHKSGLSADQVIENALSKGVNKLICVGCDLDDSVLAVSFTKQRPNCYASIGIHPHEASRYKDEAMLKDQFLSLAKDSKVVAIGECGLDYYYTHSSPLDQKRLLDWQLKLAYELKLPLIFHVREAFADFWPLFDQYRGKIKGVLHSFTDSKQNMEMALERGLYFGLNGIATFSKDKLQQEMFSLIPIDHILLETDAPYLTPTPYRGTINEPKQIRTIAEFLSKERGIELETLANATTSNANLLFKI